MNEYHAENSTADLAFDLAVGELEADLPEHQFQAGPAGRTTSTCGTCTSAIYCI